MKTRLLIIIGIGVGIAFLGIVIFDYADYGIHLGSSGNFIENVSPDGYPRSSDIPLYEGESSPEEIPEYNNDVEIIPLDPDG